MNAMVVEAPNRWDLYRVLAEPVRLRVLGLVAAEELAIGELAELLSESQPNVSRHVAPLRQAGLVAIRKQGTRTLVSLREGAAADPVVADALASGEALCRADGSLKRIEDVVAARDALAREFFAQPPKGGAAPAASAPPELAAYLAALAPLLPRRELAVDAGTGDGGLLEVLAPTFKRVVAVDRSGVQLAQARERIAHKGFANVALVEGSLESAELKKAVGKDGADVVFAVRVLHHAPRPGAVMQALAQLVGRGGALVVLDYARHDDESMRDAADLWLGFEAQELKKLARAAGLERADVSPLPRSFVTAGPDAHLPWQVLVARKREKERGDRDHGQLQSS